MGGPFSNNSYFGSNGDDGVYEASASAINGIGLFRIVVGNEFQGSQGTSTIEGTNFGNVIFGAIGSSSNVWFYEGITCLSGRTVSTVNSAMGMAHV